MKKTTKQLIVLMLILGVGCILEGCRKESNHSVTITLIHAWGGTEEDHVAMREIYEEFQEENPDINFYANKRRYDEKSRRYDNGR